MSVVKKTAGVTVAAAAAALFVSGAAMKTAQAGSHAKKADVKCSGINACKGHGACATANNACKGHNACKGQGWVSVPTAEACTGKGGKVIN